MRCSEGAFRPAKPLTHHRCARPSRWAWPAVPGRGMSLKWGARPRGSAGLHLTLQDLLHLLVRMPVFVHAAIHARGFPHRQVGFLVSADTLVEALFDHPAAQRARAREALGEGGAGSTTHLLNMSAMASSSICCPAGEAFMPPGVRRVACRAPL